MSKEITKTEKPKKSEYKICEVCGERVKAQGYGGHLFLKHDKKIGVMARLDEVQGRLDEIENANNNPGQDPDLENCLENIDVLMDKEKSAEERIKSLENFINKVQYDPDKTLWMEEKDWDKTAQLGKDNPDDEEDNPGSDEEEEKDNPGSSEKDNPEPGEKASKKLNIWDRITKAIGIFEVEE